MPIVCSRRSSNLHSCRASLFDFLLPSSVRRQSPIQLSPRIGLSQTTGRRAYAPGPRPDVAYKSVFHRKSLTQAQRDFLTSALRVNQAGELAATLIYAFQTPPLVASHPHLRPLMKHMYDQEAGHLRTFNELLARYRVRPTAMYPIWSLMSSVLGWSTAIAGREAAMACTEAVETEIGEHYNTQIRVLLDMVDELEKSGDDVNSELRELISSIRRIRDEELEHLDHAVENDAKEAVPYAFLTGMIRAGCKAAIWISERV